MHLTSSQHQLEALASRSFTNGVSSPREGPFWYRGKSAHSSDLPSHFLISSACRFPFCHVLLSFVLLAKDYPQPTVLVFILGTVGWLLSWLNYPLSPTSSIMFLKLAFLYIGIYTNPTSSVAANLICESMFTSPAMILYGFTSFQMDSSALPVASMC